jgi:hypothetical protein
LERGIQVEDSSRGEVKLVLRYRKDLMNKYVDLWKIERYNPEYKAWLYHVIIRGGKSNEGEGSR